MKKSEKNINFESTGFTEKQLNFCYFYSISKNATQSAINAGYSEKAANRQGHKLLQDEKIRTLVHAYEHYMRLDKKHTKKSTEVDEVYNSEFVLKNRIKILKNAMIEIPKTVWDYEKGEWVEKGKIINNPKSALMCLRDIESSLSENGKEISQEVIENFLSVLEKV